MTRRSSNRTSVPQIIKPVANTIDVQRPTFSQTIKEGFGLGVGVSVAQNLVNGLFSIPKSSNPVEPTKSAPQIEYEKCLKYSSNDADLCKSLLT
jgi:hypothetical protein